MRAPHLRIAHHRFSALYHAWYGNFRGTIASFDYEKENPCDFRHPPHDQRTKKNDLPGRATVLLPRKVGQDKLKSHLLRNCEQSLNAIYAVSCASAGSSRFRVMCQHRIPTPKPSSRSPMLANPTGRLAEPIRMMSPNADNRVAAFMGQYAYTCPCASCVSRVPASVRSSGDTGMHPPLLTITRKLSIVPANANSGQTGRRRLRSRNRNNSPYCKIATTTAPLCGASKQAAPALITYAAIGSHKPTKGYRDSALSDPQVSRPMNKPSAAKPSNIISCIAAVSPLPPAEGVARW